MTCEFTTLDAAYVLGSLAPAERTEYERHLGSCDKCSRSVRELAGLPGLLARVPADVLEPSADRQPVPETLLPGLVAAAERHQRRRTFRTALLAAAAVAVIAGGSAAVAASLGGDDTASIAIPSVWVPTAPTTAPSEQMSPVGDHGSSKGWVSVTPLDWGARVDLTCVYHNNYGGSGPWTYTLVVVATNGLVDTVKTFDATQGEQLKETGVTTIDPDAIAAVEVRNSYGDAILRLRQ